MSSWACWAILLPAIGALGFAQVNSKTVKDSRVPSLQTTKDPKDMSRAELATIVRRLDADLFAAYNDCKLEKFGSFFPEKLEFYHDQSGGGPMTREQLVAAIKQNICGKVHRELVSIEVFPMKNYGALETGVHGFTHPGTDNDQADARFVQLWKYEGGRWWLTVVMSYDHNEPVNEKR